MLRVGRAGFFLIATGALMVIHVHGRNRVPPLVEIGDISPRMNFSTVRVEGVLADNARPLRDGVGFYAIDDGTGTLAVFLADAPPGLLRKAGSRVSATGSLAIGAGPQIRLRVASADCMVFLDPSGQAPSHGLAAITVERKGERVTVRGRVARSWHPPPGSKAPRKLVLRDDAGTLDAIYWLDEPIPAAVGDDVEVRGSIDDYKGTVQLRIWRAEDVRVLESLLLDPPE